MKTKVCTKCQEEYPATTEHFNKKQTGKYGLTSRCKVCISHCRKKYYEENKEKILLKDKEHRSKNKDKIYEVQKKWVRANRKRVQETKKKWRDKNPDYNKQYYKKNKEQIRDAQKLYQKQNPILVKNISAKRRARKIEQLPHYANLDLIKLIYKNCPDGYHVDHMTPLAKGGLHHESNLCYLPASVNQSKYAKTIEEFGEDVFNQHVIYWQVLLLEE